MIPLSYNIYKHSCPSFPPVPSTCMGVSAQICTYIVSYPWPPPLSIPVFLFCTRRTNVSLANQIDNYSRQWPSPIFNKPSYIASPHPEPGNRPCGRFLSDKCKSDGKYTDLRSERACGKDVSNVKSHYIIVQRYQLGTKGPINTFSGSSRSTITPLGTAPTIGIIRTEAEDARYLHSG